MENKRSAGVTIFGWIFIIFAVIGLLGFVRLSGATGQIGPLSTGQYTPTRAGQTWVIFSFLTPALSLLAGAFILRLKEWARKLVVILRSVMIVVTFMVWLPILNLAQSKEFNASFEKAAEVKKAQIQKMYQPEFQEQYLKKQEKVLEVASKSMPIFLYSAFFFFIAWNAFIVFYFTRPKVKEQFVSP